LSVNNAVPAGFAATLLCMRVFIGEIEIVTTEKVTQFLALISLLCYLLN